MIATIKSRIARILPESRLVRGVAMMAGGSALAQALTVVTAPILTRLYQPEDIGVWVVYLSLLNLMTIVATGRYELAVPLPKEDRSALDVVLLTLATTLGMTALFAVVLWFLGDRLVVLMKSESLRPYLWLLPLGVLGGGAYQSMSYWSSRRKGYRRLAQTRLNQGIASVAATLGVGAVYPGPLGLLLGSVTGQTAGVTTLAGDALRVARETAFRPSLKQLGRSAWEYRQFPLYSCMAGLFCTAGLTLPALLLSSFYGSEVAGWFGLAYKVTSLPTFLVGQAIGQVFLGEASHILRDTPERLPAFFNRVTARLLPLCLSVLAIGLVSPFVFGFVFGEQFAGAGVYAAFLAFSCAAQLVVSPISSVSILVKRQDVQLALDTLRLAAVLGAMYIAWHWRLSAAYAVAAYAAAMTMVYLVFYLAYRRLAAKLARRMPAL